MNVKTTLSNLLQSKMEEQRKTGNTRGECLQLEKRNIDKGEIFLLLRQTISVTMPDEAQ